MPPPCFAPQPIEEEHPLREVRFTCPCCGYRTFEEPPGSYEICEVCDWEDDAVQLLDPAFPGGANELSLMDSQANYARIGAKEERFHADVRPAAPEEIRDPEWRPAVESDLRWARTPRDLSEHESGDLSAWYYWKRKVP